jgi:hypothetical protein
MKTRITLALMAVVLLGGCASNAPAPPSVPASQPHGYVWKSVQIVGGGFVDGIVFHPTEPGLRYARTDIGGAYRWDDSSKQWQPILDWVSYKDANLMGVESIAVDPADANRVYLACGMYTNATSPNAAILRSDDRGKSFQRADVPFKMGGNEDGRGNGERLAVDPNDGRVLYFGSRLAGLWRSTDQAVTWSKVTSFPNIAEATSRPTTRPANRFGGFRGGFNASRSDGIVLVAFDPRSGAKGQPSSIIYAGAALASRPGIFRSTDAGETWQPVPGQPVGLRVSHAAWAPNNVIYFSFGSAPGPTRMTNGAIWKYDTDSSQWTDITPEKPDPAHGRAFGYGAVAVDAHDPNAAIASTFGHPDGEELFRTTDAGKTWHPIFHSGGGTFDYSVAPYVHRTPIHWLLNIQLDPCNSNHAMFTTGYGGWETFDLTDADAGKPTHWSLFSKGIEETVALQLISPTRGPHLISGIGDYGGFVHLDLDSPPAAGSSEPPRFGNTTGVAIAAQNPDIVVRVGSLAGGGPRALNISLGYSLDSGATWQPSKSSPSGNARQGSMAVNADGTRWIWTPQQSAPYVTGDRGATWTRCAGLAAGMRTVADAVDPKLFYAVNVVRGQFFLSEDGGATFQSKPLNPVGGLPPLVADRGDERGGQDQLYPAPDRQGDVWLAAVEGLYHSTDTGQSFAPVAGPTEIRAFGFGNPAPGANYPALFIIATINNQPGIYRSDDTGLHWIRINDDQHQYGLLLQIAGDPRIYGRVYVGTHGRGILYGDPEK